MSAPRLRVGLPEQLRLLDDRPAGRSTVVEALPERAAEQRHALAVDAPVHRDVRLR